MKLTEEQCINIAKKAVPEIQWIFYPHTENNKWNGYDLVNKDYKLGSEDNYYFQISFSGNCNYFDEGLNKFEMGNIKDYL